ncbi:hypothetical protein [Parasitella parasitica]|uniref:RING-type domain-containing protein n=1 Tax=Parasitella parasitica TaxID=35722 RepID=A0A0B7MZR6_9FUNG|nr:hypothetical protein [Parasitella parasitica]
MVVPREIRLLYIINVFFTSSSEQQQHQQHQQQQQQRRPSLFDLNDDDDLEEDDLNRYLERCSICFDSKLDMCLEYCRDQFCIECFQRRYVTEVVRSSWGLSVTKIRCPVCRVYIPQAEWAKYVPVSTTELYNKFNQPFRSFSRCCSHCETEMAPCDSQRVYEKRHWCSQSKAIAAMIQDFFCTASSQCKENEKKLALIQNKLHQHHFVRIFEKMEWRNSSIIEIHHQLIMMLLCVCQLVDQSEKASAISLKILQLELRPDTWRRLQFDHISLFPDMSCPTCQKPMCLQCGEDSHSGVATCEDNMKQLISQSTETGSNVTDHIKTLKWKVENSRKCPSCSIMINRDEGCNKVDCTLCGFSFCWECRSSWSESCSYFVCASDKNNVNTALIRDLSVAIGQGSNNSVQRAELGVPDIEIIHARNNQS